MARVTVSDSHLPTPIFITHILLLPAQQLQPPKRVMKPIFVIIAFALNSVSSTTSINSIDSSSFQDIMSDHDIVSPVIQERLILRGRRDSRSTSSRVKMLMKLLEAAKLQDCAGRVVCDLNCDATRYGNSGKKVLDMMSRFKGTAIMGLREMQLLVTAGLSGRMYYWTSHCDRCRQVYPKCFTDSDELIEVASIFDIDSQTP